MPSTPTVSAWPFSMSERPPPVPWRMPRAVARPGWDSNVAASRPTASSVRAMYAAISASPGPSAAMLGLTELIRTSSVSVRTMKGRSGEGSRLRAHGSRRIRLAARDCRLAAVSRRHRIPDAQTTTAGATGSGSRPPAAGRILVNPPASRLWGRSRRPS